MKLIFLDFDGVLNSREYFNTIEKEDNGLFMSGWDEHLDPSKIELINKLVAATGAEVVISSSWRLMYPLDELNQYLAKNGAKFTAIGETPRIAKYGSERGDEIQLYMDSMETKPEAFVIIDDSSDMAHLRNTKHFVKTTFYYGFTEWHLNECINVLNGKNEGQ